MFVLIDFIDSIVSSSTMVERQNTVALLMHCIPVIPQGGVQSRTTQASGDGRIAVKSLIWDAPNLNSLQNSCTLLRLSLPNPLKPDVKSRMKM